MPVDAKGAVTNPERCHAVARSSRVSSHGRFRATLAPDWTGQLTCGRSMISEGKKNGTSVCGECHFVVEVTEVNRTMDRCHFNNVVRRFEDFQDP
jgi:hypothetical protein